MKKHDLSHFIIRQILSKDLTRCPYGLFHGKTGIAVYLGFYSELKHDAKAREKTNLLITDIWNHEWETLPPGLSNGYMGLGWGLAALAYGGILTLNEALKSYLERIFTQATYAGTKGPGHIDWEDNLFSTALYYEKIRRQEDTLWRYMLDEHMIYSVDDIELLFEGKYPYIEIDDRLFHSILFYLKAVEQLRIYPVKTRKMLAWAVGEACPNRKRTTWLDDYICHVLGGREFSRPLPSLSVSTKLAWLCEAGFFSMLYRNPLIFNGLMDRVRRDTPVFEKNIPAEYLSELPLGMNGLCGLGYGLLSYAKNERRCREKET